MSARSRYPENIRRISVHSAHRKSSLSGKREGLSPTKQQDDGHVKVAVRCRPMSEKELQANYEQIVDFESEQRIVVHDVSETPSELLGSSNGSSSERRNVSHVYDFDRVLEPGTSQQEVYDSVCRPIVDATLEGYNGTIFVYGQTGTGKTYTMEGLGDSSKIVKSRKNSAATTTTTRAEDGGEGIDEAGEQEHAGIIPRTFSQIFDHISRHPEVQFLIRASYLEIYQEEIRDLLKRHKATAMRQPEKLELHERPDVGVYVKDLTSFVCKSRAEIERVMRVGNQNRIVGATDMNERSSRSHAIFMITIEQQQIETKLPVASCELKASEVGNYKLAASRVHRRGSANAVGREKSCIRVGKLNLVDLAGSERQRKTNTLGQRQKESIKINLSLSALGNVINSLMRLQQQQQQQQQETENKQDANNNIIHTPYRDSKLTRLLQDSLGGNARTLMIANIGPASYNYDETINTLNYASRARLIRNKPRVNEDPKDALLRQLQLEIANVRAKLAATQTQTQTTTTISQQQLQTGDVLSAKSGRVVSEHVKLVDNDNDKQQVERELVELRQKLTSLESKLLNGVNNVTVSDFTQLIGLTRDQELELEQRQHELAAQLGRERAIRDELERREELELLAKQSFSSIQQELDSKRRLIKQLVSKIKLVRQEIGTSQKSHQIELHELEQLQCVLQRELKLKCLLMDNFIPNEHVDQLLARIHYDDKRNLCYIQPLDLLSSECTHSPAATTHESRLSENNLTFENYWQATRTTTTSGHDISIRPRSEFERISEAIYPNNIRHKYQHLIEPQLDFTDTQQRLESCWPLQSKLCDKLHEPEVAQEEARAHQEGVPELQALISAALNKREPDIVI